MSKRTSVTVEQVKDTINELLAVDGAPAFIHSILEKKAQPMPPDLENRETFVKDDASSASPFSLLNGLFGINEHNGKVAFVRNYNEEGLLRSVDIDPEW